MNARALSLALLVLAVVAGAASVDSKMEAKFASWAAKHKKTYASAGEREHRFAVFAETDRKLAELAAASPLATFAHNQFSDLTDEEFSQRYLSPRSSRPRPRVSSAPLSLPRLPAGTIDLPLSFDWVGAGAVTPVRNQGHCGSCWAQSAAGVIEGAWYLGTGSLVPLSPQNLVDCVSSCHGCKGGENSEGLEWVLGHGGIMSEADYPYTAADGSCVFDKTKAAARLTNWTMLNAEDATGMMEFIYRYGPVGVSVDASNWKGYASGIFTGPCRASEWSLNHDILCVGWGQDDKGVQYWLVKNSWDTTWGLNGYIKLLRGRNTCGVELIPCGATFS